MKIITKENELKRVRAGKVFAWYSSALEMVRKNNLDYIPYEYRNERREMEIKIRFQDHNAKMNGNDKIAFLIFSLPAVMTCPGATGQCLHYCYARRDERFTTTRASRLSNFIMAMREDFSACMIAAIKAEIYDSNGKLKKKYQGRKIIVRVHESGDFYNLEYMRAWFTVAAALPRITFFAYTKSYSILDKCIDSKPDNFTIRASIWNDTEKNDLYIINKYNLPFYTALNDINGYQRKNICNCNGGCGGCGCKCANSNLKEIITKIH